MTSGHPDHIINLYYKSLMNNNKWFILYHKISIVLYK